MAEVHFKVFCLKYFVFMSAVRFHVVIKTSTLTMSDLQEYKEKLIILDYPEVETLNDEKIKDIFQPKNREAFLKWVFEKMYYPEVLIWNEEELSSQLAQLAYESGFCTSKNKVNFVTGNMKFDLQLKIIKNILNHMSLIHPSKDNQQKSVLIFREDVTNLLNDVDRVFSKELLQKGKKDLSIDDLKKENEALRKELEELEKKKKDREDEEAKMCDFDSIGEENPDIEGLKEGVNSFMLKLSFLKKVVEEKLPKNKKFIDVECKSTFDEFIKCEEDLKIISNSSKMDLTMNKAPDENNMIKELTKLSEEVIAE